MGQREIGRKEGRKTGAVYILKKTHTGLLFLQLLLSPLLVLSGGGEFLLPIQAGNRIHPISILQTALFQRDGHVLTNVDQEDKGSLIFVHFYLIDVQTDENHVDNRDSLIYLYHSGVSVQTTGSHNM